MLGWGISRQVSERVKLTPFACGRFWLLTVCSTIVPGAPSSQEINEGTPAYLERLSTCRNLSEKSFQYCRDPRPTELIVSHFLPTVSLTAT